MSPSREQRRLSAILAADVAGYTRLVEQDTDGTVSAWRAARAEVIEPTVSEWAGRIVKLTGDGFLAEFSAVQDAVQCAVTIQERLAESSLDFRIGVNLGDVIDDGKDIHGEGVNIAARIEALADPGGISVSGGVYDQVRNRLKYSFEDMGEFEVKHVSAPVRIYRVAFEAQTLGPDAREIPAFALPDKPSLVVLPFDNMSDDHEQAYFADGITEDITTALSRVSDLFVIARNSAFTYKGKTVDVREIGRALGVRYVLEGSVRKAGGRMRITGQLVDAETGVHVWADRFDSSSEDVFELQDRVTAAVAGAIEPSVTQAEIRRASLKPTNNLQAYDYLLSALGEFQLFSREGSARAIQLARHATEMDPNYAQAHAYIASWLQREMNYGWMENEAEGIEDGVRRAYLAVQLQPNDPTVLTQAAFAISHFNVDLETAIHWLDQAIRLNPNSAMAFGRGAVVRNFVGDYELAAEHADRAMRLSPFDTATFAFSLARGCSHFYRRELVEAISWIGKAARENPRHSPTFLYLASALAHSEQLDGAHAAMSTFLKLRPDSSATWLRKRSHYPEAEYEYVLDGARMAGLPD
jgi:adenylate cyclase